jgi:hypothetical protein
MVEMMLTTRSKFSTREEGDGKQAQRWYMNRFLLLMAKMQ